ncbi:MAG: sodium:solute symporter family transporter [Planctomycetales bacterium]|jgi:Na+/pantothenate symporter
MTTSFLLAEGSNAALITFMIYTLAVFGIAALSNRLLKSKSFMSEYFLGSRGLGVWAFALTFAATSSSGGSFTGFPAKIYTHGWVLALWIGSYMVVPICTMGLIGKRLNQVARASGAITIPDVLRDRFNSARFGLLTVVLIVFFMSFNLVAQFKAGALILKVLLNDVDIFNSFSQSVGEWTAGVGFFGSDAQYLVCLLFFGVAVIAYTTYGGFHAVVWTDVMQGVVMVIGVLILLPLALNAVGGLDRATQEMSKMTPPMRGYGVVEIAESATDITYLDKDDWLKMESEGSTRVFRVAAAKTIEPGTKTVYGVEFLEITTPSEIERILAGETPSEFVDGAAVAQFSDTKARYGKATISADAAVTLAPYSLRSFLPSSKNGPEYLQVVEEVTLAAGESKSVLIEIPERIWKHVPLVSEQNVKFADVSTKSVSYAYGADTPGVYVSGPGPSATDSVGFLSLSVAISFFFMWAISGSGQPSNMVRLMAFKDTMTLRRAIFTVALYYTLIYVPLVFIFCCARVLVPGMEAEPDRIMPEIAVYLTNGIGAAWLGGLLIAAPFAAVMSTVDSFLLMISSAMVRDIYQRNINPDASEGTIKKLSYLCTLVVGSAAMIVAINPPDFLQDIIVYVGSGLAACFLAPVVFLLYWPRSNVQGSTIGMLAGFSAHFSMYVTGAFVNDSFFRPYRLMDFDPIIIGLLVSFTVTYLATLATPAPPQELVRKFFYRRVES